MKRKTLFIILATLVLSLTSCAMSTDEIATYLTSINSSYQNGAYEQAQTEIEKLNKSTKNMTEEQKSKYEELQPLIEYATQKSGEINNALNDAQSLCDQKMYYEANQALDKISTDYKLPPTEQKKFDEEKTTAENGIKSVKITDALKNVETIYNGGDYDKATEELSKIDTSNLTDAQSQKYQSLQTNIANAKAAAEKAAAEKAAAEAKAKAASNQQAIIQRAKSELGVPNNLNVTYKMSDSYYWGAGGVYLTNISFYDGDTLVAGAAFDSNTWDTVRDILMYSGN